MSSSESDGYFDDDINDFIVDDSQDASGTNAESPRPAKRRRTSGRNVAQKSKSRPRKRSSMRNKSDGSSSDARSSIDHDTDAYDDVPSDHGSFDDMADTDTGPWSKNKVFVPKRNNNQEEIFVTQLTQPPSPPEMIRGPRWKKPDPKPLVKNAPATVHNVNVTEKSDKNQAENNNYDDGDDMDAAIAASMASFEEENTRFNRPPASKISAPLPAPNPSSGKDTALDTSFDDLLDDIPDDAFDSDLSMSPPPRTNPQPTSRPTQSTNRPLGVRQTSLFDMATRTPASHPPIGEQVWTPPEKTEPPTQHRLEKDALDTWVYPTNLGKIRDYQFNISQRGLFHNMLVALPTGLGKTFIAATIMLNWFRWTKDAQIIFVAPTKPLVSQQISACFGIAGIPRSQTTMLTGEASPGIRAEEWNKKRVFFMTPQTLINDLKTGIADPKRIVLLVVDEAHRATGGYAYVEVVKFLRRFNRSFRVLALTATPGSTVESVQAVIDGLEISKVEIRTEQSLDIREYIHARNTEVQTFQNSEEMVFCMDLMSRALQPLVDQLRNLNAYWGRDPMALTAFGLTKARQQWMLSDAGRNAHFGLKGKVNAIFTVLASLAHGIDLLKYHGITPFHRHLQHWQSNIDGQKGGKWQKEVVQNDSYKKLMSHLLPWTRNPEFIGHPKLEYLKQVVLNHFLDAGEGAGDGDGSAQSKTRIMIFVHFRDSAEEVTRVLKRFEPMIRPHVFVGQSTAKGSEGMGQKTQLDIVQKFKKGTYNTIVATSIGEEGLDIGEVDLIVCYDSSASPIRMLQRMGRTGRKRMGNIILLLMQGKEEENYIKAKDNYQKMQEMIASGSQFTFHDDLSPRILPPGIKPAVDKRHIDIPEENENQELPEPRRRARAPKRPPKKFHMPDNVETGFQTVASLTGGGKRKSQDKRKARTPTPEPVDIPALEDVLLTPAQQKELEHRYCNVGGTTPQFIQYPRHDAFPRHQLQARPTKLVRHGSLTRRIIGTLQKMDNLGSDCGSRYKNVVALESRKPAEESFLPTSPRRRQQRDTRPNSGPKSNHLSESRGNEREDSQGIEPTSPEQLLASFVDGQESKPFYTSQMTNEEDADDSFDPPDLSTLLTRSAERSKPGRVQRAVVDDDSE